MTDLANKPIYERTAEIEQALAGALDLEGIAIRVSNNGEREIVVADPAPYAVDCWHTHDLWSIARDVERRLFPDG